MDINEKIEKLTELLPTLPKRPRMVLDYLLKNGEISTYQLSEMGYTHAPRAPQDLKEHGIKLKKRNGTHPITKNRMAIYSLSLDSETETEINFAGRMQFPKAFREEVFAMFDYKCNICNQQYNARVLQLDHRTSFIISGEPELIAANFQPLCPSHQRAKSFDCERCPNRQNQDIDVCSKCYWAIPDGDYNHIATLPERRISLTWKEDEIDDYNKLSQLALTSGTDLNSLTKSILKHTTE